MEQWAGALLHVARDEGVGEGIWSMAMQGGHSLGPLCGYRRRPRRKSAGVFASLI